MEEPSKHISTTLTQVILLLSVVIGVLFGALQIVLDVTHQKELDVASIELLVETVTPLASQAAYELNGQAADEVLNGIMAFRPVLHASITDDAGTILAEATRPDRNGDNNPIYEYIYADLTSHSVELKSRFYDGVVGYLNLSLDSQKLGEGILYRAFNILTFGVLRNIVLAVALLLVFKWFIGAPLLDLTRKFARLSGAGGAPEPIECPQKHEGNEFGALIRNINTTLRERSEAEAQIRRIQKMEAVGQLAGGVAHDFNNLLAIASGNLELVREMSRLDEAGQRRIDVAERALERGADLTRKLLSFARTTNTANAELLSANDVIRDVLEFLPLTLKTEIDIRHALADDLWQIEASRGDLQDAILNLALNARDAMPGGGTLLIETANVFLDEEYVRLNPQARPGPYAMISVNDTGTGIPKEIRDRVIEPFFTTKAEGRGTGLGLSMVFGFIQRSGGHMNIYSEEGLGTTFRLYLPRSEGGGKARAPARAWEAVEGGSETILVVDDELDLVELGSAYLSHLGYRTLTATSGEEALQILAADPGIDLVFSDIVMPGPVDGYDLAARCAADWPHVRVLLASGFTQNREQNFHPANGSQPAPDLDVLMKPYSLETLAKSVRMALDSGNVSEGE